MIKTIIFAIITVLVIGTVVLYEPVDQQPQPANVALITEELMDGLTITDVVVGNGPEARTGDTVIVHYQGRLENGRVFDESYKRGEPFSFRLGTGYVIKGWDLGVVGMKVGGKRTLTIAPELAYGDQGAGGMIPPGATLTFDVELLGVQ